MRILVTGGCGFIGSHIVDAYIRMGHHVAIIDDLSTGTIHNLNPRATFYEEDIRNREIEHIFAREKLDVINHHAAQINVRTSVDDPLFDAQVNILGTINLIDLAAKYQIKRFIFASSGGTVYGEPQTFPIAEDFTIEPSSPYGVSKATAERYLMLLAPFRDMDYVILRYSNVYGPRQISTSEAGVISIFINQILNNEKCVIFGDGNQTRDYVYVDDVVKANCASLGSTSDILNIGTGIETSVNGLVTMLSDITERPIAHEYGPARPGEVSRNVLDFSKARSLLHWEPEITLEQGIRKTFDYFSLHDAGAKKIS